jgi:hypothetical protein
LEDVGKLPYNRPDYKNSRELTSKKTPKIWVGFHFLHTFACPGAVRPAKGHGGPLIAGSKTDRRAYFRLKTPGFWYFLTTENCSRISQPGRLLLHHISED